MDCLGSSYIDGFMLGFWPCFQFLKLTPLAVASVLQSWNTGHEEWCWSWKSATPEACCFRREAASVEVQSRCWPSAMVGVAFLMCCLEVEHGQTVNERSGGPYDRWQSTTDIQGLLFEDVAEGFGPLQSAYNAKDIGVLLQLAMAIPKIWQHLSTTRSLAFQLLTQNHMGLHHFQSEVDRQLFLFDEVQIEPGWETLWIELKPPPSYVDLRSLPLNSQSGQSACFEGSIQTLLEVHARRVHRILTAPSIGTAQAVWELMHEITRTSQSLVLFVMCPYLETVETGRSEADAKSERKLLAMPLFRIAEPPLFRNACCERYRIISWLLTELWQKLGSRTLVYAEVGVAAGNTALFLLEQLPWLQVYLVENKPKPELLQVLSAFAGRAHLVEMDSKDAAAYFLLAGLHVDAIFLDADHSFHAVTRDLESFGRLSPALMMGHDFSWEHPGVLKAVLQLRAGCPLTLGPDHVFFWHQGVDLFNSSTCFTSKMSLRGWAEQSRFM